MTGAEIQVGKDRWLVGVKMGLDDTRSDTPKAGAAYLNENLVVLRQIASGEIGHLSAVGTRILLNRLFSPANYQRYEQTAQDYVDAVKDVKDQMETAVLELAWLKGDRRLTNQILAGLR